MGDTLQTLWRLYKQGVYTQNEMKEILSKLPRKNDHA